MKRLCVFLACLVLVGINIAQAQTVRITGTVKSSEDGMPIPGVSVVVKGTTNGAATNIDGKYELNVTANDQTLVFSFVGFKSQEVEIGGRSVIDVILESESVQVEELVVTGYSVRKKDVVASSITVIGGDNLKQLPPSTSIDNMLQGKAAGVDATALNGKPGQAATIKIRGAVSLNTKGGDKSQPLYVIDGVFLAERDLALINPSDIETITVLKDASAAAIYGSRGANGVVVITTKQGRKGDGKIEYSGRYGFSKMIKDPFEMMNTAEKIQYEEAAGFATYTPEEKQELLALDHDWQKDILKTALIESHSLSFSGGDGNNSYFISGGYDRNTGIVAKLNGFERYSTRINLTSKVKEKVRVGLNAGVSHSTSAEARDRNNAQNPFRAMYDYNPYETIYQLNPDGTTLLDNNGKPVYAVQPSTGFPIMEALEKNPESQLRSSFIGSAFGEYEILKDLKYTVRYSADYRKDKREYYMMPSSILNGYVGDPAAPGSKTDNGADNFNHTFLNQIAYSKTIGEHNISSSLFTEYTKGKFHSYTLTKKGFASDILTTQDNAATPTGASTSREEYAMFSYAGLVDYNYSGRYMASFSLRQDAASRFGENKQKGVFWSTSIGWNVKKESFLADVNWLDNLKLTLSYGTLGSWNIPNYASRGYNTFGSYNSQTTAFPRLNVANPDLTWETQKTTNIGVEASFLNKRITANVDYFINKRSDFLFENPLPWESGGYTQYLNAGDMVSKGVEFSINGDVISGKDLRWSIGANITTIDYEIKKLNGQTQIVLSSISVLKEGEEPFTFYLPRYAGVDPANGDALYYDKDGNVTNVFSSGDAVVLSGKSPLAKLFGGFNTSVNFKGIDFNADFAFKLGNYTYNYQALNMLSDGDNSNANQRKDALDYWKQPGDNKLPRLNGNSNQTTDRFLQDASYLRFRGVTLGYTLPKNWVSVLKVDRIRIYAQAQNLYTWTKYEGNPEVSIGSGDNQLGATQDFIPGLYSLYSYPATRSFIFGIDIKF